jgi:hypothetical protein
MHNPQKHEELKYRYFPEGTIIYFTHASQNVKEDGYLISHLLNNKRLINLKK